MAKYYKVNLYRMTMDWENEPPERWVGQTVVKKGIFYAKDIISGKKYEIVDTVTDSIDDEFENIQEDIYTDYDTNIYYGEDIYYEHTDGTNYRKQATFVKSEEFTTENRLSLLQAFEYAIDCSEVVDYTTENCATTPQNNSIKTKIKNIFQK